MSRRLVMILMLVVTGTTVAGEADPRIAESRAAAQELGGALKSVLVAAMQAGGPVSAISVCNAKAPQIAGAISVRHGWEVGRTTLKVRNPANAPDAWERAVLERFERERAAGAAAASLEFAETVQTEDGSVFRYMKAIPTGEVCLTCHGTALAPEVGERIAALYPRDQATGFGVGDIRGAFTISIPEEAVPAGPSGG